MKAKKVRMMLLASSMTLSLAMGNVAMAQDARGVEPAPAKASQSTVPETDGAKEEKKSEEKVSDDAETSSKKEETKQADTTENEAGEKDQKTEKTEQTTDKAEAEAQAADSEGDVSVQATGTAYWNPLSGNDNQAGDSRNNAVKTLDKAKEVAGQGGTVYLVSKLTVTQSMTISDVTLKCEDAMNDDMIYVRDGATLTLENATIDGTRKDLSRSPYIINVQDATVIMEGATKVCNGNQGAFYLNRGTLTMNSGEICGNGNVDENYNKAGAVQIIGGGRFNMNGGEIYDNQAYLGGAIRLTSESASFTMTDGSIHDNTAVDSSGAIDSCGKIQITGGSISGNTAGTAGGGLSIWGGALDMSGGEISGNVSGGWGGGINAYGKSEINISVTAEIKNNESGGNGAGVYLEGGNDAGTIFNMTGGSITGNTAESGAGGAIMAYPWMAPVTMNISGGTISGNTGWGENDGISVSGATNVDNGEINDYGKLKLSGSPTISDKVDLRSDLFENIKVEVTGTFKPVTPVPITDHGWLDNRVIVTYTNGLTANPDDFTPADGHKDQAIIVDEKDPQSLVSIRKINLDFVEKGYIADGKHTLYKEMMLLPKSKIPKEEIPEVTNPGYTLTGWANNATWDVWDFDNDILTEGIQLYPVWKLDPANYTLSADKTHIHTEEGGSATLKTEFTQHAAANVSYEWQWYKDGKKVAEGTGNDSLTITEPGEYKVIVIATDGKLKSDPVEKNITIVKADEKHAGSEWKSDAKDHWKECVECKEKMNTAAHTFSDWMITKQPTTEATGLKEKTCSVCGYKVTEEIPKLTKDNSGKSDGKTDNGTSDNNKQTPTKGTAAKTNISKATKTGDTTGLGLAMAGMAIAAGAGVSVVVAKKRKERE